MNQYKRLAQNSIIFAIANFGSKILTFALIPYYTFVLTTSEYGIADTMLSTLSLMLPFVTLYIQDAVMRFSMDKNCDNFQVLSVGIIAIIFGAVLSSTVVAILYIVDFYTDFLLIFWLLVVTNAIYIVIGQYVRGCGKIKSFAFGGFLFTIILCLAMPFFLSVLKMKVQGFLWGQMVAYLGTSVYYMLIVWNDFRKITLKINKELMRQMVQYSLPLMPNAIMWWIMNASDRYMIIFMIGTSAAGIYSVAYKIPSIMNMITTIFFQAFQISAIEEKDSVERHSFYSKIYNYLFYILIIGSSGLIFIIRPILNKIVSADFREASLYAPFLLISFVFSAMGAYYGTFYAVEKKTSGALKSTILGAIANVVGDFFLIPLMGINGAALGTFIGMVAMFVYRAIDTYKYEKINYDFKKLGMLISSSVIITMLFYWSNNISMILQLLVIAIEIVIVRMMLVEMVQLFVKKFRRKAK